MSKDKISEHDNFAPHIQIDPSFNNEYKPEEKKSSELYRRGSRRMSDTGEFFNPHVSKVTSRQSIAAIDYDFDGIRSEDVTLWNKFMASMIYAYGKLSGDSIRIRQSEILRATGRYHTEEEILADIFVRSHRPSADLNRSGETFTRIQTLT
ncbi:hypothetical protein H4219_003200 [Mycoemilia scoparia]|uniref:Uncharacterized protein n=1 Tax=Mycoemilia scoparia TaxID=417184 RepID=A0A9W8DN64_9FUNG|nr:hypothetical protein H4219_003200 [Mycoemilia scoparia]